MSVKLYTLLNNPLRYTDPTGEFLWIVAGIALGGVVNWAMNGAQLNAKGLGYFGVGALAGAAGGCLAGGISSAMAGGSFIAGALGTSSALTSTGFRKHPTYHNNIFNRLKISRLFFFKFLK